MTRKDFKMEDEDKITNYFDMLSQDFGLRPISSFSHNKTVDVLDLVLFKRVELICLALRDKQMQSKNPIKRPKAVVT